MTKLNRDEIANLFKKTYDVCVKDMALELEQEFGVIRDALLDTASSNVPCDIVKLWEKAKDLTELVNDTLKDSVCRDISEVFRSAIYSYNRQLLDSNVDDVIYNVAVRALATYVYREEPNINFDDLDIREELKEIIQNVADNNNDWCDFEDIYSEMNNAMDEWCESKKPKKKYIVEFYKKVYCEVEIDATSEDDATKIFESEDFDLNIIHETGNEEIETYDEVNIYRK